MPLPLFLGIAAAVAGTTGIGAGIHGAVKMKKASDTMKSADVRHKQNIKRFEEQNIATTQRMDALGEKELDILASFQLFACLFEQIHNKPDFKAYSNEKVKLPEYDAEEIKRVSVGAGVLMGGLGGAALGTAGGFAAAGATTAAVMALGTASTGTAIASLSGVAATNATLAALGGGSIAAGGGGMALGTTILGVTTLGAALLVGGIIFSITGSSISTKADQAWEQVLKAEKDINHSCVYLMDLRRAANKYNKAISAVDKVYRLHLNALDTYVNLYNKKDWNEFTEQERLVTENTVLLVQLLYKMCQVKLVNKSSEEGEHNELNAEGISDGIYAAESLLEERNLNQAIVELHTDEENYCVAMSALLYYFAWCDGKITEEEHIVIHDAIAPLMKNTRLSATAQSEMDEIKKMKGITFFQLREYLDRVSTEVLEDFSRVVDNVVNMNDNISEMELKAKEKFDSYFADRKKNPQ